MATVRKGRIPVFGVSLAAGTPGFRGCEPAWFGCRVAAARPCGRFAAIGTSFGCSRGAAERFCGRVAARLLIGWWVAAERPVRH